MSWNYFTATEQHSDEQAERGVYSQKDAKLAGKSSTQRDVSMEKGRGIGGFHCHVFYVGHR